MDKINARLLVLARHLRQYTQKEASQLMGISQGKLSKAEHDLQEFPLDLVEELSRVYNLPIEFFFQTPPNINLEKSFFRRVASITEKNIDSFKAKISIQLSIIDKLFEPIEIPRFDLITQEVNAYNSPESIAQEIRQQFKIPFGPIPNLIRIIENHGVIIQQLDFENEKIDAFSAVSENGRIVIFLNSIMPNDRMRFSLAHELGHVIMHQFYFVNDKELAEIQANAFASELLMPANEFKYEMGILTMNSLAQLKRKWKVSMHAIVRSARDRGYINDKRYKYFQILFSKNGYTKIEPYPIPFEKPILIEETINLYQKELGYNARDLSKISCIGESEFKTWFKPMSVLPSVKFNFDSFRKSK